MADLIKGLDISVIQGNVDFQAVAASGVQFVIARCGVGNGGIDADYSKNLAGATATGLKFMAYHFIYPLPPLASQPMRDPLKQAQYHFNAAQGQLAAIDCEWPAPQDWTKWGCTSAQINQWMLAYFQEYTRLDGGRKPALYTYPYWAQAVKLDPQFAQYPLWIASYQATPAVPHPWTDWTLWQNSGGTQHLPNGGVPVDTDYAKDLSLWGVQPDPIAPDPGQPVNAPAQTVAPSTFGLETTSSIVTPGDPVANFMTGIWNSVSKILKK